MGSTIALIELCVCMCIGFASGLKSLLCSTSNVGMLAWQEMHASVAYGRWKYHQERRSRELRFVFSAVLGPALARVTSVTIKYGWAILQRSKPAALWKFGLRTSSAGLLGQARLAKSIESDKWPARGEWQLASGLPADQPETFPFRTHFHFRASYWLPLWRSAEQQGGLGCTVKIRNPYITRWRAVLWKKTFSKYSVCFLRSCWVNVSNFFPHLD